MSFTTLPPPLVGRNADLGVLRHLVDLVAAGAGQALIVEGDPGTGKTRLVHEVSASTTGRVTVLWAAGDEQTAGRPFAMVEHLDRALSAAGDGGGPPPRLALPLAATVPPDDTGLGLTEAFVDRVEIAASPRPLVLVVDDLHLVDGASLGALGAMGRRLADLPVGLIGVTRRQPRPTALERLIGTLHAAGGWVHRLGPLGDADRDQLLTTMAGGAPGAGLRRQAESAGGNPLYLVELVRALDADGLLVRDGQIVDTDATRLPPTFRQTIRRRLGHARPEVVALLRMASVLGTRFAVEDLAAVAQLDPGSLVDALGEACRAGVVLQSDGSFAFSHALVRDILYQELSAPDAADRHRRYAQLLASQGAAVQAVAAQFSHAASPGDREAASWLVRAARATQSTDPATAADFLRRALAAASDDDRDTLTCELAAALAAAGETTEGADLARSVLSRGHDPALDAPLRLVIGRDHLANGRTAAALTELEAAGATPDGSGTNRREALSRVGLGWLFSGDLPAAEASARRVLELGERFGDDVAVSSALCTQALLADCACRVDEALTLARQAVTRADASPGGRAHWFPNHLYLAYMLMDNDRLSEAAKALRDGQARSTELGATANIPAYHFGQGVLAFLSGQWDTAIAEIGAGLLAAADIASVSGLVWAQSVAAIIAIHSDDLPGAAAALSRAEIHLNSEIQPFWHWSLWAKALLREAQGDLATAASIMDALYEGCVACGSVYELVEVAPDLTRLGLATGARQRAEQATATLEEVAHIARRDNAIAAAQRCRGLVNRDPELLVTAHAMYARIGRPMHAAWAATEAADLLIAAGRTADATSLLNDASRSFENAGAQRDLDHIQRHALATTSRSPQRSTSPTLTTAQRNVARLVADGLTSAEIGRQLFISTRTVDGHLARIYTTLGIHTRAELAAWYTRTTITNPSAPRSGSGTMRE